MTVYSKEMINKICHRITQGKTLVKTCNELKIDTSTVYMWLKDEDKKDFIDRYAKARELQAHVYADDIIDIADDESKPVDSRRVRIDARKWHAGKNNLKYADKQSVDVNHKGTIGVVTTDLQGLCSLLADLNTGNA